MLFLLFEAVGVYMIKYLFLLLLTTQTVFGMQFDPDDTIKEGMQDLPPYRSIEFSSKHPKPFLAKFEKPQRIFIAKMDTFGSYRYFIFKTDQEIDELLQSIEQKKAWKIEWFFYDNPLQETPKAPIFESQEGNQAADEAVESGQASE